ncbi:hypothetical protein KR093_003274 [Drosophila rubida]|uniref:Kinesin-like protein KIF2A-like N-terminal domain-containing protein n=1 Tax=Drosophila rubida TaxID=30044 RepID=A0AAD4PGT2_9MUSC|nr:hypothetical protein KR093_003274 [Drosophila rubida]
MEHICVGEKVTICRTDGRVHTAIVDSKNVEELYVIVTWKEGAKIMGKEIPWSSVLALNPHLDRTNQLKCFDSKQPDDANLNLSEN